MARPAPKRDLNRLFQFEGLKDICREALAQRGKTSIRRLASKSAG